jgi:hypothetical protein
MSEKVDEISVIGKDDRPLAVLIQSAGGNQSCGDLFKQIDCQFFRMFIRTGTNVTSGFVEQDVPQFFCGGDLEDAHSALADTDATVAVLLGQLAKHPELPRAMAGLAEFSAARDADFVDSEGRLKFSGSEVVINFGKNSGRRLRDLVNEDPGFLRWMLRSDFSEDVKNVIKNALSGEFPTRQN